MFIQVIQGRVRDEERLRSGLDRWLEEFAPHAEGWLGGTYGITDDGMFVGTVRFASEEAARRNSQRPEQDAWWREMSECFDGEVTFHDCTDVMMLLDGGTDDAGFVQVIQGKVRDRDRMHSLIDQTGSVLARERPDIIGGTIAIDDDGVMTETVAFTDEAAAREGERRELSSEARQLMRQEMDLIEDVRYLDLHEPWFASHR
ncbi:hypothetical protein G1H11_05030 [Phytoactinopolyspora alkaliphila]|uniref:ABM domain-containing protein n=1 Tax=Phytoactinopolyspora alkaliphila TaxID=1783498 RepID=A0A6N9YII0_9ACTN|nr:hypothetical protein [Phytoactinopolyspora alkaliphila]NED94669.1 hypothetical protein [Phytoactinopolyspora alkaliphila]